MCCLHQSPSSYMCRRCAMVQAEETGHRRAHLVAVDEEEQQRVQQGLLSEFLLGSIIYSPFATTLSLLSVTYQTAVDLDRSPKNVHTAEKSKIKNVSAKRSFRLV